MKTAIKEGIERELKAARDIAAHAESEDRDLTTEERAKVTAHIEAAKSLKLRADNQAELSKQLDDLGEGIGLDVVPAPRKAPEGFRGRERSKSLGTQFVESDEWKGLISSVPNGHFGEKARVHMQPWGVKSLVTGASDTSAGAFVTPTQYGFLDPFYERPLTIRQLVTNGQTASDSIEYVRLTSVTNNAATVAEATTAALPTQDGSTGPLVEAAGGGYKPESAMAFERVSTTVKTIAHWIPVTKRALSDAGQVRTLIDAFLLYGLDEELEDQILMGNGSGENFTGINSTSGIQTQAAPSGGQTVLDTLRMARRKVRIGGRTVPTGYAMHPIDWEAIELMKDGNDRYYGQGPFGMTDPRLWGLPVVESEAVAQGTAWVANWKMAVLWDREEASIQVTDSHADFFVRNLVAILAELRAAFGVLRPSAFVKVTLA